MNLKEDISHELQVIDIKIKDYFKLVGITENDLLQDENSYPEIRKHYKELCDVEIKLMYFDHKYNLLLSEYSKYINNKNERF